jgi:hypothetical protein
MILRRFWLADVSFYFVLLPILPCRNCGNDLFPEGFYNSCSETQRVRVDNSPIVEDRFYLEHDEDNFETVAHECDVDAYCASCGRLLLWGPLRDPRRTRGHQRVRSRRREIAKLVSQLDGETRNYPACFSKHQVQR